MNIIWLKIGGQQSKTAVAVVGNAVTNDWGSDSFVHKAAAAFGTHSGSAVTLHWQGGFNTLRCVCFVLCIYTT